MEIYETKPWIDFIQAQDKILCLMQEMGIDEETIVERLSLDHAKIHFRGKLRRCLTPWKHVAHHPKEDDKTYLVCWKESDGTYSSPHRAYYLESEGKFFSLENNNSHPIVADIFIELPELPKE